MDVFHDSVSAIRLEKDSSKGTGVGFGERTVSIRVAKPFDSTSTKERRAASIQKVVMTVVGMKWASFRPYVFGLELNLSCVFTS